MISDFYKNKKVLITGHTGFKGSWLCMILRELGADIYGYSLNPPTTPNLYHIAKIDDFVTSEIGDVRDYTHIKQFFDSVNPDIVFHLAAQPLVIDGYDKPRYTYETNVMGTVNLLECIRENRNVKSFVNITTDKVYENDESNKQYKETDKLDGNDPYSNSKSCSDIITHCYRKSFLKLCPTSTVRAGNVIGGGDFSENRIIPDCIRSAIDEKTIKIRNPNSIRPFQHVLEPLFAYLKIAYCQCMDNKKSGYYNIGPDPKDSITVGELANIFCKKWGDNVKWVAIDYNGPREANYLKLDNTKAKTELNITPIWEITTAIEKTIEWTKEWQCGGNIIGCMKKQIAEFMLSEK